MEGVMRMRIPVIDLLGSPEETEARLLAACEGVGCFRVINHGVAAELQSEMKAVVKSLFGSLPDDVKQKDGGGVSEYVGTSEKNPLYEALGIYDPSSPAAGVDAFCAWLHALPHQREVVKSYASKVQSLILDIAAKVAESLSLKDMTFKDWSCEFWMNRYNFTQESVGSFGVNSHTDRGFLTVLKEDECVGGLEVMDEHSGSFVAVDPVPGSFLVILGDMAKAWSNGRLHNAKHRVQCKEAAERFSTAFLLLAPKNDSIEPPEQLVDSEHPRLFRTFNYRDYGQLRKSVSHAGEALSPFAIDQATIAS